MFLFLSFNTLANAVSACCFEMFKNIFFFMSGHELLHFRVKLIGLYVFHPLLFVFISLYMNMNYSFLTTIYESIFAQMYILLVEKYVLQFGLKIFIVNRKKM